MSRPIGRLWIKEDMISGYIVVNGVCVKFGAGHNNTQEEEVCLIFPSKKKG
jgi:hypothetical protein